MPAVPVPFTDEEVGYSSGPVESAADLEFGPASFVPSDTLPPAENPFPAPAPAPPPVAPPRAKSRVTRAWNPDMTEEERQHALRRNKLELASATEEVERLKPTVEKVATAVGLNFGQAIGATTKQIEGNVIRKYVDLVAPQKPHTPGSLESYLQWALKPTLGGLVLSQGDVNDPGSLANLLRETGRLTAEEGTTQQIKAGEESEALGGGPTVAGAGSLAYTAGASVPALAGGPWGRLGLAITSGLQTYGTSIEDFKSKLMALDPSLTEKEAFDKAFVPAAASAAAAAVLTRAFGGTERFIEDQILKRGLSQIGIKGLLRETFKAATMEFPEEYLQQMSQGLFEKAYVDPNKSWEDIKDESAMAGLQAFVLGGVTAGTLGTVTKGGSAASKAIGGAVERSRVRRENDLAFHRSTQQAIDEALSRNAKNEVAKAGGLPAVVGESALPGAEVQTETGAAQRPGEGGGRSDVRAQVPPSAPPLANQDVVQQAINQFYPPPVLKKAIFGGYLWDNPNLPSYKIPGVRPGIFRDVSAATARQMGYQIPERIPTFDEWNAAGRPATVTPEVSYSPAAPGLGVPPDMARLFPGQNVQQIAAQYQTIPTDALRAYPGGATRFMHDLGSMARTPEDVAALRSMAEQHNAQFKALTASGDFDTAMMYAGRQPGEAFEYATGTTLNGGPKYQVFEKMRPGYLPPVPGEAYVADKAKLEPRASKSIQEHQVQTSQPIDWNSFTFVNKEGNRVLDMSTLRQMIVRGELRGQPGVGAMLLHLMQPSSKHPLNPVKLITTLTPDQVSELARSGVAAPTAANRAAARSPYAGLWIPKSGTNVADIEINGLDNAGKPISQQAFMQVLAHELTHNNIDSKIDFAPPELQQRMHDVYNFVLQKAEGTAFARENAMENVRELFAEASNNTELQTWLKSLGYKTGKVDAGLKNTVWGQILDIVRLLLDLPAKLLTPGGQSIDTITALDEIMQLSAQLETIQRGEYGPEAAPSPAAPGVPPVLGEPPVLGPTPPGMNLSQAQVASGTAEIGRVAESVYKAREDAGTALEGLAYERLQYRTARTALKDLRDQASLFYRAQGIDPDNFKFPDPRDGVTVGQDGQVTVDNSFTGALNAASVPHDTARVQGQQAEVWFEGAAHRYNNLSRAIETLQDAAVFYGQHLPDPTAMVTKLNKQIAQLNQARNKLGVATLNDQSVSGRAQEMTTAENMRVEQLGQRDALSLEPVMDFFGTRVGGYRQVVQKVQSGLAFVQAAAQSETNPAAAQAALAEADKWMNIPQDVKNSILEGKPLSDDQMSAIYSALAQSFEEFDYAFARMRDMSAAQIPEINTQIRDTLQKVADAKVNKNASEEMLTDVMGTVSPDLRPLKERASAVGSFARFMGDTLDNNQLLYQWMLDPSAGPRPSLPANATMGTDAQTLDMILTEVSRNPDFAASLVTLIEANHNKLTEIPMTAFEQIGSLLKNPSQENLAEAENLGRWLYRNARGRASLASESLKANLKQLDNLAIERRAQQEGQAMFQQLASSPDFARMRQAVSDSRWGLVEPMIEQNHVSTTFKPFGFPGLPSHPGLVMDTSVDPFFQADWMKKKLAWEKAAAEYVTAYDVAQGLHEQNGQENPTPQQLGFDIPKVRGLRDAVERSIPGAFLDVSLGSDSRRWKVPDLARKLSKSGWFRQHDFVAKMVGGQTGLDLRNKVGDFINHYLISQGIRDNFRDLPLLRHAALKSHSTPGTGNMQMNLANYKEFYNELGHRGRMFGSDLKVGLKLPRSGIRVTKEDMALLAKERDMSEQLRRRVTESNPTQGVRVKTPTRTLVRPGASVGDQGLPRFPGRRAEMFMGEATGAYNIEPPPGSPKGTPPTVRSFAPEPGTPPVNLGESSTNPVVAFWNRNMDLVVQHILDINRQDRAMQVTPGMRQAEQELAGQWENFGVQKPKSIEELVQRLTDLYPSAYQTGVDPRDAVIKGLDSELRQFRDAAQRTLTQREERAQARAAEPEIAFSADNEFTKPAALLELPSPLYDYGPLSDGEHMAFVSRANHERIIAYATAINRAIVDLQNRINRANHPDPGQRITAEKAAEAYGGNMSEMEDTLTILKRIQKDFKDAYSIGSFSGKPSGLFNDTMGLLTSGILAMPTVGLRNMTQGQMAVYAMNRAMGNAGHIMTGIYALKNMANTLVRFGVHFADGMVKTSNFWASKLSGTENRHMFEDAVRKIGNFLTRDDFRTTAEQVRNLGLDSREGLIDRLTRIWQQSGEFVTPQEMENSLKVPGGIPLFGGRKVKALAGLPFRWTKALFDKIGVNQYDFAINTSSLWNAEFLARRIKEVATAYGKARENLGTFDPGDPKWELRPNEWSTAYKAHAEDSLNTIRLALESSVGPLGFQLERSMWDWYQRRKTDPNAQLFTTAQMEALQRRLLMDFNAATPVNRPSAAGANNVVRTLLTLQGYPSDLMLKLVNSGFGKTRSRGDWVNATMKAPVLVTMALMSILLGYATSAVTGTWEKYAKGRIPSLATPFDKDFWTNFKRWAEGSVALGAAQWGYIGDLILLMMKEVRGNRGFDPTGRILAASLMERGYKAARGLIDTSFRGAGNFRQGLVPLLDVARTQLPFVPELERALWFALGSVKQSERIRRGEAITQGLVEGKRGFEAPTYGPTTVVRRELGEYVSRYYDAKQAGNEEEANKWLALAKERVQQLETYHYNQYIANGKSAGDARTLAKRDTSNDYADLNPAVASLLGKRPSKAQEELVLSGISGDRRAMVDRGDAAWRAGSLALFNKTGVTTREQAEAARGGGGRLGSIPGMPRLAGLPSLGRSGFGLNAGTRGAALPSVGANIPGVRRIRSSVRRQSPLISVGRGPRGVRTSAAVRSVIRSGTRRRAAPKVGGRTTVRGLGTRRRREYAAGY